MRALLVGLLVLTIAFTGVAQNIARLEYFIDTDPGLGLGVNVPITPSPSLTNFNFNVPVTSLTPGFHTLYFRSKNSLGAWSITHYTALYKLGNVATASLPNITRLEYFIDTDPGLGQGTSVPITPGASINNLTFNVPVTSLSPGFHTLYIRSKNALGGWSITHYTALYKLGNVASASVPNITRLEYFIDTDPGLGQGTSVPITPGASIGNLVFNVPVTSLTPGFHTLYIRAKNATGGWSITHYTALYKLGNVATAVLPNLSRLEYFIDSDPGEGNGTTINFSPGTSVNNLAFDLNVSALTETTHRIFFRAKDQRGGWSIVQTAEFAVCNKPPPTANAATVVAATSFTANWSLVTGATEYLLDVSTNNFTSYVTGYQAKSYITNTASVTGLTQGTTYQYRVRAVVGCTTIYSNTVSVTTPVAVPTASPTNLLFANSTTSSFNLSFTAASGTPTGYLVVRKAGSASTFVPQNDVDYTAGQTVSDGVIAYKGSNITLLQSALASGTVWHIDIYSYNQIGSLISYRTTSPLKGNYFTQAVEPPTQPTALTFQSVTSTGYTVNFTGATGSPTGYLVFRNTITAPTFTPVDGTTYTVNTTYGDSRLVAIGAATSFNESGLTQLTNYHYAVYAYNGAGLSINYRSTSPLTGNVTTALAEPVAQPTNIQFSSITSSSITVSYTAATGSPAGYLVLRRAGSSSTFVPTYNASYTLGQQVSTGVFVAYTGANLSFVDMGLTASTVYHYDVFSYNQNGALVSYQAISPLEGSISTFTAAPSAQPSNISFSNITSSSMRTTFTPANPAASGYLAIRNPVVASNFIPVDGTSYTPGQNVTNGVVIYNGADASFDDAGLLAGTVYVYTLFSYNGSGTATNYVETLGAVNTGSKITLPGKPIIAAATNVQQTSFTANWNATTGTSSYRLDVSKDNFATLIAGYNDLTVTGVTSSVTGLEQGVAYKYRVRAVNESGVSVNSDENQQFTIPATPITNAATNVTQTSFTASWNSVIGATGYFIDVSSDDFATFAPGFQNSTIVSTSVSVTGLNAGTTYKYRVRSVNSGGTSPNSNTPTQQLLIPATPVGEDAANVATNSFKAKWAQATGATEYRLDVAVASDNFNPSLPEYTNKLVTLTEELITGLLPNTIYRYRVRAANATGISPDSAPVSVSTLEAGTGGGVTLQIGSPTFNSTFSNTSEKVTLAILSGTAPYTVNFYHRQISKTKFIQLPAVLETGTTYAATITAAMLDEIGAEFYFSVSDGSGATRETNLNRIYKGISAAGIKIPFTRSGGTLQSYEMFSIPYELTDNLIEDIFEEMGTYEKSEWRLVRFQGGRNVDYGAGINRIEQGKGYWFNQLEKIDISFTGGTVTKVNQDSPFVLRLEPGWNQIGNPFPFDLKWSEVVAANGNSANLGELKIYQFQSAQLTNGDDLKMWSGGFVHNDATSSFDLVFPISLRGNLGGRMSAERIKGNNPDQPEWFVPISMKAGDLISDQTGFGMHPNAIEGKDWFDDLVPPRWGSVMEMYVHHDEFFEPKFQRDIISSKEDHVWDFIVESEGFEPVIFSWNNNTLASANAQLFLFDEEAGRVIDMKKYTSYSVDKFKLKKLKILYNKRGEFTQNITLLGNGYPNPATSFVTIPFVLSNERTQYNTSIEIYDVKGQKVKVISGDYVPGVYEATWAGVDEAGNQIAEGVYLVKLRVNGAYLPMNSKVIFQRSN